MTAGSGIRVAHLTTVHRPFDVRIFHKECTSLAAAGYDVTLIQRGEVAEMRNGVRIIPLPTYRSRTLRMVMGTITAMWLALRSGAHVLHLHDAELIPVGILAKLMGRSVVLDAHEDLSKDLEDKAYLPRAAIVPIRIIVRIVESLAARFFDLIVPATNSIWNNFPKNKSVLVRNTPIVGELASIEALPFNKRPPCVAYFGGLAALNGPDQMICALGQIPASIGCSMLLGGNFLSADDEVRLRGLPGWSRIDYKGWVERADLGTHLANAVAGLVVYQPSPNIMEAEPNKFFEILSAGLPLIASDFPAWRSFIDHYGCGLVVDPSSPAAIADAIVWMISHREEAQAMGERGRRAINEDYNWTIDAANLVAAYNTLTGKARIESRDAA